MLYKTLGPDGTSGLGREDKFPKNLPAPGQPGPWAEVEGALKIEKNALVGDNGIHLATRKWIVRYLCDHIFEAEYQGERLKKGRFLVARKVRLIRELGNWNERNARLFAADCAERILDFYERKHPGDQRPRQAIAMARQLAKGEVLFDDDAVQAAGQAALEAYEATEDNNPAKSAAMAAWSCLNVDQSAASVAREVCQTALGAVKAKSKANDWAAFLKKQNRKKEMSWQSKRLFQILYGPLPPSY